ncbi:MAG: hypothetical protein CMN32_16475 [Saprospirales bacterium]|nr:hypothetical protein [Saprospirales bacterium]
MLLPNFFTRYKNQKLMKLRILQQLSLLAGLLLAGFPSVNGQTVQLNLTGMTPHVGQKFEARLVDKATLREVDRTKVDPIGAADFSITLTGEMGGSYYLDFYADLNQNGTYDAPPVDHAWRMDADNLAMGVNNFDFAHAGNFTDIEWRHTITMNFTGMTPHVGQMLEIRVRDINQTGREVGRVTISAIEQADFSVTLPFVIPGRSYFLDFFADLNQNGQYDAPPMDHAWREMVSEATGDMEVDFMHAANFTDIGESGLLRVNFSGMNPHVGQLLELRVINSSTGAEVERHRRMIVQPDFAVEIPGVQPGENYDVDFYADLSQNGLYDAPPMDHAWQESFTASGGTDEINFSHNASFSDIEWKYLFTLEAEDMQPHVGQKFELRVVKTGDNEEVGRFSMPSIVVPHFFVRVPGLELGDDYNIDFYADFNQNGVYDAPPMDHAWRENLQDDEGDETITFHHNTSFTDIMFPTAVREISSIESASLYPNPAVDFVTLELNLNEYTVLQAEVLNMTGAIVSSVPQSGFSEGYNKLSVPLGDLPAGLYFLKIQDDEGGLLTVKLMKK